MSAIGAENGRSIIKNSSRESCSPRLRVSTHLLNCHHLTCVFHQEGGASSLAQSYLVLVVCALQFRVLGVTDQLGRLLGVHPLVLDGILERVPLLLLRLGHSGECGFRFVNRPWHA